jgi:hypothetical protein
MLVQQVSNAFFIVAEIDGFAITNADVLADGEGREDDD